MAHTFGDWHALDGARVGLESVRHPPVVRCDPVSTNEDNGRRASATEALFMCVSKPKRSCM